MSARLRLVRATVDGMTMYLWRAHLRRGELRVQWINALDEACPLDSGVAHGLARQMRKGGAEFATVKDVVVLRRAQKTAISTNIVKTTSASAATSARALPEKTEPEVKP